jgi:hypothetical protein
MLKMMQDLKEKRYVFSYKSGAINASRMSMKSRIADDKNERQDQKLISNLKSQKMKHHQITNLREPRKSR